MKRENLYKKINSLKDNANFHFLNQSINLLEIIFYVVKEMSSLHEKMSSKQILNNCVFNVYTEDSEIYLDKTGWCKIYLLLIKGYRLNSLEVLNLTTISDKLKEIIKVPKTNNLLETHVESVVEYFKTNDNNSKKYFIIVKIILSLDEISSYIQHQIHAIIIRNKKMNNMDFIYELSMTKTGMTLGTLLLSFIFQNNTVLKFFFKTLKNIIITREKLVLEDHYSILLQRILEAHLEQDVTQLKELFKEYEIPGTQSTLFIEILTLYFIDMLYIPYKSNKLNDIVLNILLSRVDFIRLKQRLSTHKAHIGFLLLSFFVGENNLFTLKKNIYHKYKKDKSNKIIISKEFLDQLFDIHDINKPFLVEENIAQINNIKDHNEDILLKIIHENYANYIRFHHDLQLTINEESYLKEEKPYSMQTIDKNYLNFLIDFLMECSHLKDFSDINTNYRLYLNVLYTIYDVDFAYFEALISTSGDNIDMAMLHASIIEYSLNFNKISVQDIATKIKTIKISNKAYYYTLINKISQNKITFINALKEAIILSPFKYFFNSTYIDSRGRLYNSGIFTNVQLYPLLKAIIKPFSVEMIDNLPIHRETTFNAIKSIIISKLYSDKIKTEVSLINQKYYKEQSQILKENYIYNFFKPILDRVTFNKFFSDVFDAFTLLSYVICYIKKRKRTLYVHSMILLVRVKKGFRGYKGNHLAYINNYYELDATASGLQMISLIFRETSLALHCNLVGNSFHDIYQYATVQYEKIRILLASSFHNYFVEDIDMLLSLRENSVIVYSHPDSNFLYVRDKKDNITKNNDILNTFLKRLRAFFCMDLTKSSSTLSLLKILHNDYETIPGFKALSQKDIIDISWMFSRKEKSLLKNIPMMYNKLLQYLLQIKHIILYKSVLLNHTWIERDKVFNNRDLFKKQIMTYFYNATSFSRKEDFANFLKDNNNMLNTTDKRIIYLSKFLDNYFSYFMQKDLSICMKLIELSKELGAKKIPVTISNKNFKIVFNPTKVTTIRIQTTTYKKNQRGHQISLKKSTNIFDKKAFIQKFNPNFIHSADASIVHLFNERLLDINYEAFDYNFYVGFGSNHDTFWLTMPLFLKLILKDCYFEFYDSQYILTLSSIDIDKYKEALKENTSFNDFNNNFMK